MELDDIKQQWDKMNIRITPSELKKRTTSLETLMSTYRRFSILAIGCILCSVSFYQLIQSGEISAPPAVVILYIATMAIASVVDGYLYHSLKEIDLLSMTVSEVSRRATACRRVHLLSQLVLFPLMLAFIITVAICTTSAYLRYGILAGALLGLILGLNIWLKMMRTYRTLIP